VAQGALRGIRRGGEVLCLGVWPAGSRPEDPTISTPPRSRCPVHRSATQSRSATRGIELRNHDTYTPAYRAAAEFSRSAYQAVVCGSEDAELTAQAAAACTALEES